MLWSCIVIVLPIKYLNTYQLGSKRKPEAKIPRVLYNYEWFLNYNSNAFLTLLSINNVMGSSSASFTATKNPTDSRPSITL